MAINIRAKGQNGEREVANMLNARVLLACDATKQPRPQKPVIQRNQNQSAVGGSDLTNPFGIAFEIKRQENLSVNSGWAQCTAAAEPNGFLPVLIYRASRQPWRVVTWVRLCNPDGSPASGFVRAELLLEDFLPHFQEIVVSHILSGKLLEV